MNLNYANVVILGGTGTLGRALTARITKNFPHCNLVILSRDEHKHAAMKRDYPKVRYVIGDIRAGNLDFKHVDVVFHVAALKHVDLLEDNPLEAYMTNVEGTYHAVKAAYEHDVPHFVFSSTDKAVDPVNAYGYSKAMAEKIIFDLNKRSKTNFSIYRWGNVLGSNGSAIPHFIKTLKEEGRVYITDTAMTRFWLTIEQAVDYMLATFDNELPVDEARIPLDSMKSASLMSVVEALASMVGARDYTVEVTGMRPGEKKHEVMRSAHSNLMPIRSDLWDEYSHDELVTLLTPIVERYK